MREEESRGGKGRTAGLGWGAVAWDGGGGESWWPEPDGRCGVGLSQEMTAEDNPGGRSRTAGVGQVLSQRVVVAGGGGAGEG